MNITATQAPDATIDRALKLFDDLFFQGELSPVRFEWNTVLPDRNLGQCRHGQPGEIVIQVDPQPTSVAAGEDRAWSIFGTLLHECVHAVFKRSCAILSPPHGFHNDDCADSIGWTGHGPAWEHLARDVEERAQRLFGEYEGDVDLHIDRGMLHEQASLASVAPQAQVQTLHSGREKSRGKSAKHWANRRARLVR